jgi:glycerol dehydrogenase
MPSNLSVFGSPERYVQGREATLYMGEEMMKLGIDGPVLIVAGRSAQAQLCETWKATLSKAGYEYQIFKFGGECTSHEIEDVVSKAKEMSAKCIIGAGGGKVIDTARAAADQVKIDVCCCPTAASSDAPCSALSVVYREDGSVERYLFFRRHPLLVLLDTTVIANSPKRLLVAGMGDALATWYEARTVKEACKCNFLGGTTTMTGMAIAELCKNTLLADGPTAVQALATKSVTPALERVVEANTLLSGLGFECVGVCVAHSVHNGLASCPATHDYMHGEKVAFGLMTQLTLEGRPASEIKEVMCFCSKVGLPITLKEVGLDANDEAAIEAIGDRTVQPGETAHNEPFEVTSKMVQDAVRLADRLGTLHHDAQSGC